MSTKQELQEQAVKLQDELDKLNSTIASMKSELPEGFIAFEATANSKCPCHPKDVVLWATGYYPNGVKSELWSEAEQLCWNSRVYKECQITGYKIVKKYVEPRPMRFSEIPVGQVFKWAFFNDKTKVDNSVFMKTNAGQQNSFGEVLSCVILSGSDKGCVTIFRDTDGVFFFQSSFDGEIGELLTV